MGGGDVVLRSSCTSQLSVMMLITLTGTDVEEEEGLTDSTAAGHQGASL